MTLPWKRFWVPLDSHISCGILGDGFFDDPEDDWSSNKENARHLDDLLRFSCLILSGEPGLGKSVALEQAFPGIPHQNGGNEATVWIRFRDIPDASAFTRRVFDSPRWVTWHSGNHHLTLVLDGLDEGLIKIKDFLQFLTSEIRSLPLDRLKIIVACRTADWPVAAGNKLLALWNLDSSQAIWELCPLRRVDAEEAAKSLAIHPEHFLKQVFERHVTTLASRPTTLFFLLRQFATSGHLEGTHRDIYERGILDLCREPDPERAEMSFTTPLGPELLGPEQKRDAAAYLGAMLILTGKSALSTDIRANADVQQDIHIESLLSLPSSLPITNHNAIIHSTKTALFSSRGEKRLGFSHQTFAECLAARHVQGMPLVQLRELFCQFDERNEYVIPQLAETAAWLACMNDAFLRHLLEIDPEVILRSDIANIQGDRKHDVVHAVLERAKKHELFDDIGLRRFLSALYHEGLPSQLWAYICDENLNIIVRRLAIAIAHECRLSELNDRFLAYLQEPTVPQQIRDGIAHILSETIPHEQLAVIEALAKGAFGADPEDRIKACAFERLVPNNWSVATALEFMTPPRDSNFIGPYQMFLRYHAPKHVSVEDLDALLTWLYDKPQCLDSQSPFCELAHKAVYLALLNLDKVNVRDAIVRLWVTKRRRFGQFRDMRLTSGLQKLWNNASLRRSFAVEVAGHPETTEADMGLLLFGSFPIFVAADLGWMLECLPSIRTASLDIWTYAISRLAYPEQTAACWDLFLLRLEEIPSLGNRFLWLREWNLDEPVARNAKANFLREERARTHLQRGKNALSPQKLIASDIEMISRGEYSGWVNLCDDLRLKEGETLYFAVPHYDVTEMPGWQAADDTQRHAFKHAATQFLLRYSDGHDRFPSGSNYAVAGYLAIWLLREEIEKDTLLQNAVSRKWIHGIIGFFNNAEDHFKDMAALAYRLNPDEAITALRQEADRDYHHHGYIFAWRGFERCWDTRISSLLMEFVLSHCVKEKTLISSLCALLEFDKIAGHNWMRKILPSIHRFCEEAQVTILAIAHALAPKETWDQVWPIVVADQQLGKKVMLIAASDTQLETQREGYNLTSSQLGLLASFLYQSFPPDPAGEQMNGFVTPRQAVGDYRRKVMDALTSKSDLAAGTVLLDLAAKFPQYLIEFRWRYRDHLKTRGRILWHPPSESELSELIARSQARLVSTERDLFEVILESLQRFEDYYTKRELPAVERLWRWEKDGNRRVGFHPKDEEDFSDELSRWITDDIGHNGIIVSREVQIERKMKTDLLIKALGTERDGQTPNAITVVVEVKGCWNPEVEDGAENQLVQKYLIQHDWTHGIYLVGWFSCESWKPGRNYLRSITIEEGRGEVRRIGEAIRERHPGLVVAGILLDCRYR